MQVSIYDQGMFSFEHLFITVPLISISTLCLGVIPVSKSSDFVMPLLQYKIFVSCYLIESSFEVSELFN